MNDSYYQNASRDLYAINSIELEGDILKVNVSYGGGCEEHEFVLIGLRNFNESNPVQVDVLLSHNANNDLCEA